MNDRRQLTHRTPTWKRPMTVASKGQESTMSKGAAGCRLTGGAPRWPPAVLQPRGGRSGRVVSLWRTFLVTAWV